MDSTQIYYGYLNMVVSHRKQTIYFLVTTWIEANSLLKLSVYFLHIKLSIQRISSCLEATMNVLASTGYMASMMNVSEPEIGMLFKMV